MSSRMAFFAGVIVFVTGAVGLSGAIFYFQGHGQTAAQPSLVGGPFSLVDQNGQRVTETEMKGKPHLVFFGFTHCPDICPTSLFEITEVLNAMGPDASKASALFVTVDPERDTPEAMKSYLESFSPLIRGLTGTQGEVDAMVKAYRVYAKKQPLPDGGYTMDHTAVVYLMDKNGSFVAPLNLKRPPEEVAAEVKRYI